MDTLLIVLAATMAATLLLVMEMAMESSLIRYAWRAWKIRQLGRTLKIKLSRHVQSKSMIVGFLVMRNNEESDNAIVCIRTYLKDLGIHLGDLHEKAAWNLYHDDTWYDNIADTSMGIADIIIVGHWNIQIEYGLQFYVLHCPLYRNNGYRQQREKLSLSVNPRRPQWLTETILIQQGMLLVLEALHQVLDEPAPRPNRHYHTGQWPYYETPEPCQPVQK